MSDDFDIPPLRHRQEIKALKSDLAAHKAALADVVERAAQVTDASAKICDEEGKPGPALYFRIASSKIRSLAPPDAAPYARVLEAARAWREAKRRGSGSVENREALVVAGLQLQEAVVALAAIEEPRLAGIGRG